MRLSTPLLLRGICHSRFSRVVQPTAKFTTRLSTRCWFSKAGVVSLLVVQKKCLCSSGLTRECSFHRQTAEVRLSKGVSVLKTYIFLRHTYSKVVPLQELDRRLSKKVTHSGEAGCKPIRGMGVTTLKASALNNSTAELLMFSRSNILIWVKGKDVGRLRCEYLRPSSGTMA